MNSFVASQILVGIAIVFDVISFQLKNRKYILLCLVISGVFISSHFILLKNWTASMLMLVAILRYTLSIFSTSRKLMYFYVLFTIAISFFSYQGSLTILSCLGSSFQTIAAFKKNDKQLRELMIVGTSFWLIHNYLSGSPIAVLMEIIFISSNIAGYYRYYIKKN